MLRPHRAVTWFAMLIGVWVVAACAGPRTSSREPSVLVVVPIIDVNTVAGTWVGLVSRDTGGTQDDWLEIKLNADGTFETFGVRQIGALVGKGSFTISDGKIAAVGQNGSGTLTLYDRQGRVLMMDFRQANGARYSAELRPKR